MPRFLWWGQRWGKRRARWNACAICCSVLWGAAPFLKPVLGDHRPSAISSTQNAVVVHSYPPGEWYHAIQRVLEESAISMSLPYRFEPVVFHAEYWLRKSLDALAREKRRILGRIRELRASAVILCDDEAADAFAQDISAQGLPLFLTGINRDASVVAGLPGWGAAGIVFERYPVGTLLESAARFAVRGRRIAIVSSRNPSSKIIVARLVDEVRSASPQGFQISHVFESSDWQEWKNHLSKVSETADWVWVGVPYDVRDAHGAEVPVERIARWMRKNVALPSLGLSSVHAKMGVLLTVAVTPEQLARSTAEQIRAWHSGTPLSSLAQRVENQGQLQINVSTARRLKLAIPKELRAVSKLVPEVNLPYGR